jgi:hypothetical protein
VRCVDGVAHDARILVERLLRHLDEIRSTGRTLPHEERRLPVRFAVDQQLPVGSHEHTGDLGITDRKPRNTRDGNGCGLSAWNVDCSDGLRVARERLSGARHRVTENESEQDGE